MTALVALGETMALLSAPVPGRLRDMSSLRLSVAGAESNVAIGLRRLGHDAAWVGRVGADEFGQLILSVLRREGVDVTGAVVDTGAQTALMFKERRFNVSRVSYYRSGYAGSRLSVDDIDGGLVRRARVLHVTGITLGLSPSAREAVQAAVALARAAGVLVSFDLNYRAGLWSAGEAAPHLAGLASQADVVFASEEELRLIEDNVGIGARSLREHGVKAVVVKRGAKGASVLDDEGWLDEPSLAAQVVDPVGAGDAFVAGYLTGIVRELDRRERLHLGCVLGACLVGAPGDWEGLPTWEDLAMVEADAGTTLR